MRREDGTTKITLPQRRPTFVQSFNVSIDVRTYHLGLGLRQRHGRYVIESVHPSLRVGEASLKLRGWTLLAVSRLDGTTFDVVEMHAEDFHRMIRWPFEPLESDTEVILELQHPRTLERATLSWNRFPSR